MLFSVVIAVRNENKIIERCLEGVLSQDIDEEFEVFVVDGMSDDGTFETLQELKKKINFSLLRNKKINLIDLVSHKFKLSEFPKAIETIEKGSYLKIIFDCR